MINAHDEVPRGELKLAYFSYDPEHGQLALRSHSRPGVDSLDASLPPVGPAMELVRHAAKTGQPVHLPDCRADARWSENSELRSIYIVPASSIGPCDVLVLASQQIDGISRRERMLANLLIHHIGDPDRAVARDRSRVALLERGLRRIRLEIAQLCVGSETGTWTIPNGMADRLRLLSPREWQVMERLRSGLRVITIASELAISPNTVRNHLKSIYRKLGVRSQVELLEKMRDSATSVPAPI